jgi:hypothetical protein
LASDQAYPARRGVEEDRIALGHLVDLSLPWACPWAFPLSRLLFQACSSVVLELP